MQTYLYFLELKRSTTPRGFSTTRAQFMWGLNQSDYFLRDFTVSSSKRSSVILEASDNMDIVGEKQPSADATNPDQAVEIDLSSTFLDLTSFQLRDLDSVELPANLTELDLTANRLTSLDSRISHLSNLKKLSLRQNLINDAAIEPISSWDALACLEVFLFLFFQSEIALKYEVNDFVTCLVTGVVKNKMLWKCFREKFLYVKFWKCSLVQPKKRLRGKHLLNAS